MLRLPDAWSWDFWIADTATAYHVFYLRASRALGDPIRRHHRASVGHAVSSDLTHWTVVDDALLPADQPAWNDKAIWTGSVVADPDDGTWRMFYTALSHADTGAVQRIGMATSTDLFTWSAESAPCVVADRRWYELHADARRDHEAWRDPWVFADPGGNGWHMLITARARDAPDFDGGVIGHAWSPDLKRWQVRPPLSRPGAGFDQQEVPQVAVVDGRPVLIFSCLDSELAPPRRGRCGRPGVWALPCTDPVGPYDMSTATPLIDEQYYSGRLVQDRSGDWQLIAFHNIEPDGSFDGRLSDPMPVHWVRPGVLAIR